MVEASADLGATPVQTCRRILLPHLATAIVSSALLTMPQSFDEALITVFLSGDQMILPLRLWPVMRSGYTQASPRWSPSCWPSPSRSPLLSHFG